MRVLLVIYFMSTFSYFSRKLRDAMEAEIGRELSLLLICAFLELKCELKLPRRSKLIYMFKFNFMVLSFALFTYHS